MNLYHFTSDKHILSCMEEGLVHGVTFVGTKKDKVLFFKETQWLTKNPTFDQTWNKGSTLPYNRTANRITIDIPKEFECNALPWEIFSRRLPKKVAKFLAYYGDHENWVIYMGHVKPEWFRAVSRNIDEAGPIQQIEEFTTNSGA